MGSAVSCQFPLLPCTLTVAGLPQKSLQQQQAPDYGFGERVSSQHTLQLVSIYFPRHWLPFGRADSQAPRVGLLSYPLAAHNQCGCTLGSKVFLNCCRSIWHGKGSKICCRETSPGEQWQQMSSIIVLVCGSTTVKSHFWVWFFFLVHKICGWLKSHSQSACFLSMFFLAFEDYASLQCKSCDRIHYCLRHDGWAYFGYAMCAGSRGSWQCKGSPCLLHTIFTPVSACKAGGYFPIY